MNLIRHIIQYFTHWNVVSISKNSELITDGVWYECRYFYKVENDNLLVKDIAIWEQKQDVIKKEGV